MSRLELAIAMRYLRSRRGSRLLSFITVIAIGGLMVGVGALIVIMGVMNGLQYDLREKILVGSPDIRVLGYGDDLRIQPWKQLVDSVRKEPGVVAAAPFVLTQGLMRTSSSNYMEAVSISGIIPADDSLAMGVVAGAKGPRSSGPVTTIRQHAASGDFRFATSDGKRRGAVLGKLLADRLHVGIGSKLTAMTSAGVAQNPITGGYYPRLFELEVTGTFDTGLYEYDNSYVFVDIDQARELAGLDKAVTGIEVKTTDRTAAAMVAARLEDRLGFPYRTVTWEAQNQSLFRALKLEKAGMGLILMLIITVAALNIVSTLTMVVRDKTREVGILKAMGLRSGSVLRIFLVQGLVIGIVGTGLGLLLGGAVGIGLDRYHLIALDPTIYFIDHLPVRMQSFDVLMISALGIVVAAVATVYPALQASRLYPLEAIRSE
jgi:lipoprotein-releasing system permease protein